MARRSRVAPTLERKIHFYRANIGADGRGQPLIFDPTPALTAIGGMPFADGQSGRYLVDEDGNALCVWPTTSDVATMRFCQIRRTGLPQLEQAGTVSDLNIATDAGLLEPVHVVFFSDNIVGADFNFYGPRLSRLGFYLRVKSGNIIPLATFEPLLRLDVAEQLDHLTELRLLDLKIRASYSETIRQADTSLGDAFAANARVLDGDAEEIRLVLQPAKDGRREALRRLLSPLKALLRGRELRENVARFQVKGKHDESNKVETIDLLRDQLIARKQVMRIGERSRAINPDSAFAAIRAAHDELAGELRQAVSLSS
ncbi:hypothetical protein AB4Z01_32820 [Inquilinus sp. YAF38]|uniref:hypothetical protein n=1 Tax=Inquilinus sp. YAF38 TaxID=3233084 RepID=UPI003F9343B6